MFRQRTPYGHGAPTWNRRTAAAAAAALSGQVSGQACTAQCAPCCSTAAGCQKHSLCRGCSHPRAPGACRADLQHLRRTQLLQNVSFLVGTQRPTRETLPTGTANADSSLTWMCRGSTVRREACREGRSDWALPSTGRLSRRPPRSNIHRARSATHSVRVMVPGSVLVMVPGLAPGLLAPGSAPGSGRRCTVWSAQHSATGWLEMRFDTRHGLCG